jgi:hypothetical protein
LYRNPTIGSMPVSAPLANTRRIDRLPVTSKRLCSNIILS